MSLPINSMLSCTDSQSNNRVALISYEIDRISYFIFTSHQSTYPCIFITSYEFMFQGILAPTKPFSALQRNLLVTWACLSKRLGRWYSAIAEVHVEKSIPDTVPMYNEKSSRNIRKNELQVQKGKHYDVRTWDAFHIAGSVSLAELFFLSVVSLKMLNKQLNYR